MRGDCHNALLGRDTTSNVTFQAEFFPGGDFEYRYEDRTLRYRVIVPYDWDNDGIHNERDGNPTAYDGDFFGVANALPSNANTAAYYWLDLSVTGRVGVAEIRITCDGVSNLGDHLIIARTNEVCHVPLLIGASYSVESDLPFECVAASDSRLDVQTLGDVYGVYILQDNHCTKGKAAFQARDEPRATSHGFQIPSHFPGVYPFFEGKMGLHPMFMRVRWFREFCEASEFAEKAASKRRRERHSISPRQNLKNG